MQRFESTGKTALRWLGRIIVPLSRIFVLLAPKQCNEFAFAITKTGTLQSWMENESRMSLRYATDHGRMYRS